MRIFLAGVACVGKTTIGARLANLLGCRFFDLDLEVERFYETSIERLQSRYLTSHSFRLAASRALTHLLSHASSGVAACDVDRHMCFLEGSTEVGDVPFYSSKIEAFLTLRQSSFYLTRVYIVKSDPLQDILWYVLEHDDGSILRLFDDPPIAAH